MTTLFQPETNTIDPQKNYRDELVGEGKKFKTDEDLARGKYESDAYINTLTKKLDEVQADMLRIKQESDARASLEDLVTQMKTPKEPAVNTITPSVLDGNTKPYLSNPDEVKHIASSTYNEMKLREQEDNNLDLIVGKLKERYGDNYTSQLKTQATSLGLSDQEVEAMARRTPNVLIKALGLDARQGEGFQAPPRSGTRTDQFSPNVPKRTWAYYQNLKKTNSTLYWDPKTTVQMHKDAEALGTAFEDGDFNAL